MKKLINYLFVGVLFFLGIFLVSCDVGSSDGGEVVFKTTTPSQNSIAFVLDIKGDEGSIGLINVSLFMNEDFISSLELTKDKKDDEGNVFTDLLPYQLYTLQLSYDNGTNQQQISSKDVTTLPSTISLASVVVTNEQQIMVGDTINLAISLDNPSNTPITSLTVDGKVIDVASSNYTTEITTSIVCNFIGEEWDIVVGKVTVKVNNLPVEYTFTENNVVSVEIGGSMTFSDFKFSEEPSFVKKNELVAISFTIEGDSLNLYEVHSLTVNGKTIAKDTITFTNGLVETTVSLTKEGVNEVKLTKITLTKDGVEIFSNLDFVLEIYVASSEELKEINTKEELLAIKADEYKMYHLKSDIDLSGVNFTPFSIFKGYLNGNNHTISGLNISGTGAVGLFTRNEGVISNVIFETPSITLTSSNNKSNVGIVTSVNEGVIKNVYVSDATINGDIDEGNIGGISGVNNGSIEECYFIGDFIIDGNKNLIGGISATNGGNIKSVFSVVDVNALNSSASGIVAKEGLNSNLEATYYYMGQSIVSKSTNEIGEVFTNENLNNLAWYHTELEWDQSIDWNIIKVDSIPDVYSLGSMGNPKLISNLNEFITIDNSPLYGYYRLTADIDFTGINFTPINSFRGILDGDNHIVSNITINTDISKIGLFKDLYGIIKNVTFDNCHYTVNSTSTTYVGILAGYSMNSHIENVVIKNSEIEVTTSADVDNIVTQVGGIVGYNQDGTILSSAASCVIDVAVNVIEKYTVTFVGGIVGINVNGLINEVASNSTINVSTTGNAVSLSYAGGIVGYNDAGKLIDAYAQGSVTLNSLFIKSSAGGVYGGGSSTGNRNLHFLDGQDVKLNNNTVEKSVSVHKSVIFSTIEDINEWNQTKIWGILN